VSKERKILRLWLAPHRVLRSSTALLKGHITVYDDQYSRNIHGAQNWEFSFRTGALTIPQWRTPQADRPYAVASGCETSKTIWPGCCGSAFPKPVGLIDEGAQSAIHCTSGSMQSGSL
jgi:hypothetical protein